MGAVVKGLLTDLAIVDLLWIGEINVDTISDMIQDELERDYSHCAAIFRHTGMLWHSTIAEDGDALPSGVREEEPRKALKGSVIRLHRRVILDRTNEEIIKYLESERFKPYAFAQAIAEAIPGDFLDGLVSNGPAERHCSEFVGALVHNNVTEKNPLRLKGDQDRWRPTHLEEAWTPTKPTDAIIREIFGVT